MKTLSKLIFVLGVAISVNLNLVSAQEIFAPSEVTNVTATPGIGEINISWDQATDEDGVISGYKIYYGTNSVQAEGDAYESEVGIPAQTSTVLKNLENGKTYYLAITALDDEGNESETYSEEVSVLLNVDRAPQIMAVKNVSMTEVEIEMSKKMAEVPFPEAFMVENVNTETLLLLVSATTEGNKISLKLDEELVAGENYLVTATSAIEDTEGNPVASGVTDHLEFVAEEIIIEEPVVEEPSEEVQEPEEIIVVEEPEEEVYGPTREDMPHEAAPVDETAPIDATNFTVDSTYLKSEKVMVLNWEKSLDLDEDVADQVLYTKVGLGDWDTGFSVGKELNSIEMDVVLGENYEVKLVTVDSSGNESKGVSVTFTTKLAQSGSGGYVIALSVAILIGFMVVANRRRAY